MLPLACKLPTPLVGPPSTPASSSGSAWGSREAPKTHRRAFAVLGLGLLAKRRTREPSVRRFAYSALVVGGTGRVGGSTARWLRKLAEEEKLEDFELAVAGRSRENYAQFAQRWPGEECGAVPQFVEIDHTKRDSIREVLNARDWDLLVHTAGPFQGIQRPLLLEEALKSGTPYVDVCDDTELCKTAKELCPELEEAKVPAVVSAGIWPGVSALMVCEAVEQLGGSAEGREGRRVPSHSPSPHLQRGDFKESLLLTAFGF
eukprot:s1263_g6.t1